MFLLTDITTSGVADRKDVSNPRSFVTTPCSGSLDVAVLRVHRSFEMRSTRSSSSSVASRETASKTPSTKTLISGDDNLMHPRAHHIARPRKAPSLLVSGLQLSESLVSRIQPARILKCICTVVHTLRPRAGSVRSRRDFRRRPQALSPERRLVKFGSTGALPPCRFSKGGRPSSGEGLNMHVDALVALVPSGAPG